MSFFSKQVHLIPRFVPLPSHEIITKPFFFQDGIHAGQCSWRDDHGFDSRAMGSDILWRKLNFHSCCCLSMFVLSVSAVTDTSGLIRQFLGSCVGVLIYALLSRFIPEETAVSHSPSNFSPSKPAAHHLLFQEDCPRVELSC